MKCSVIVAVLLSACLLGPVPGWSQAEYDWQLFDRPLALSRGTLEAATAGAEYLSHDESCRLVVSEFGWGQASCDYLEQIVIGHPTGVDTLIVRRPNSDGYVQFDDWGADADEEIDAIWESYLVETKAQSDQLGVKIEPLGWAFRPTLDKENSLMYYAVTVNWDGETIMNVEATYFDRKGYVSMSIVPEASSLGQAELEGILSTTLNSYHPADGQSYADFTDGDQVAAVGAMGVLAALLGAKFGKGFIAAAFVVVLAFLKKFWFLALLIPLAFAKRLFAKK